jgi:uncharacterized membrane protein
MTTATFTHPPLHKVKSARIESIDLLRGIVMIIMALDHVRDYFHSEAFLYNPLDLSQTSASIFFTRWITHFCAPVFVFLAGTSAYLVGQRKGKKELSAFLLKRGIWLLVLEFTIINFSWFFNIQFSLLALTVIWALGIGMIILSAVIHLPFKAIIALGIVIVAGHNLLDSIHVDGKGPDWMLWSVFHENAAFPLGHFLIFVGYPILPWTGIMILGYTFGRLYQSDYGQAERERILFRMGVALIFVFIALRFLNIYGDPNGWTEQKNGLFTLLSFINVTKYPPSLLYVLITLGPALLLLSVAERFSNRTTGYLTALGRVPMFYYIVHLYAIHILGTIAALATGFELSDMVFNTWVTDSPNLKGYGFSLGIVYIVWAFVVLSLFPLCLLYDRYKTFHREKWWLSYL